VMGEQLEDLDWGAMVLHSSLGLAHLSGPEHRLKSANPALLRMAGRNLEQLADRPLLQLLLGLPAGYDPTGLDGDELPVLLDGALARWVRVSVTSSDGAVGGDLLAVVEDVSEQKALFQQMLNADRLMTLGGLAASLQHDLSQPLNVMRLTAENALDRLEEGGVGGNELQRQQRSLSVVIQQLKRTQEIFDLTWSYGHPPEEAPAFFDPRTSIATAIERVRQRPCSVKVGFEWDEGAELPFLYGHAVRLEELLFQLLQNSCEAYLRGSGSPTKRTEDETVSIVCRLLEDRDLLAISVADNGPGLPPALVRRLNRPTFTSQPLGKGLGLLVAFGIAAELGGWIEVPSDGNAPGQGARFDILLPLALDADAETPPHEEEMKK